MHGMVYGSPICKMVKFPKHKYNDEKNTRNGGKFILHAVHSHIAEAPRKNALSDWKNVWNNYTNGTSIDIIYW